MEKEKLILLDIDETLFYGDSFLFIILFYLKKKPYKIIHLAVMFFYALAFILKIVNNVKLKEIFLKIFEKEDKKYIENLSEEFVELLWSKKLNQKVFEKISELVQKGYKLIVISASPEFYISKIGSRLNAFKTIATKTGYTADQKFLPEIIGQNCKGKEKILRLNKEINTSDYDLQNSYAFSDSITDMPMFEIVGNRVAVNPETRLLKYALNNKFEIIK